jgi:PleD family two-component response regulator
MSSRILLIAESSTLRFLLKRSLQTFYDDIVEASTNEAGIQLIESDSTIKGIVLNWLVLRSDEFKLIQSLLSSPRYDQLPVIVITTQANEQALNWVKKRGHAALTLLAQFEDVASTMENLMLEDSEVTAIMSTVDLGEEPVRILFVDDSKSSRAYYVRILEQHQYMVTTAESVETAWKILEDRPASYFDLVITDYFMPDENGHILCRRIRKNPEMHDLLTAVMTGTYFDDVIDISLRAGAIECMFKEESDQLFRTVRETASC